MQASLAGEQVWAAERGSEQAGKQTTNKQTNKANEPTRNTGRPTDHRPEEWPEKVASGLEFSLQKPAFCACVWVWADVCPSLSSSVRAISRVFARTGGGQGARGDRSPLVSRPLEPSSRRRPDSASPSNCSNLDARFELIRAIGRRTREREGEGWRGSSERKAKEVIGRRANGAGRT